MSTTGYTVEEWADYSAALRGSHELKTSIQILDNNRSILGTLDHLVLDGQVDGKHVKLDPTWSDKKSDQSVEVSRVAKGVTLLDPTRSLGLESTSPSSGALYLDRCIRIICSVRGKLRWYPQDVFTGPITLLDRDGPLVTLEAQGMEAFGLGQAFTTDREPSGLRKTEAFANLMRRSGEVDEWMDLPTSTEKIDSSIKIVNETRYWDKAFSLMASMNRECFYDGSSMLLTPEPSRQPVIEFGTGDDGLLLGEPQVTYDSESFRNAWYQVGSKDSYNARVWLPDTHPLSPSRLGRNGKPKYLMGTERNPELKSDKACKKRANYLLGLASQELVVRGESRPVYHLRPGVWARSNPGVWSVTHSVDEFSLSIVAGGSMTYGYRSNLTNPSISQIRRA